VSGTVERDPGASWYSADPGRGPWAVSVPGHVSRLRREIRPSQPTR